jgi:hypothetical protein
VARATVGCRAGGADPCPSVVTATDGTFVLGALPAGPITLFALAADGAASTTLPPLRPAERASVTLRLPGAPP